MFFTKDDATGTFHRGFDQLDHELLFHRQQHGTWPQLITALAAEPVVHAHEYDLRLKAAFILWGLEAYEEGPVPPAGQRRGLRVWTR